MLRARPLLLLLLFTVVFFFPAWADVIYDDTLVAYPQIGRPFAPAPFRKAADDATTLQEMNKLEIWFGRVRICDAFVIRCNGETMLIDGGMKNTGKQARDFLYQKLNLQYADYMLNTHHHDDHLEMQISLLREGFKTNMFLTPYPRNYPVALQRSMQETVDAYAIPYQQLLDGDTLMLGGENGALLQFFRWSGSTNANYSSLMMKVTYNNRSALFMADVSGLAQTALLHERKDIPWQSDILKVGHHGYSVQCKELLDQIRPSLCVMTNTKEGGKATVSQMKALGYPLLLTPQGSIYMYTDGEEHWFFTQDKSYIKK